MRNQVRCMWFEDDGTPILKGCRNRQCTYVHPDSRIEWEKAERRHQARHSGPKEKRKDFDESSWQSPQSRKSSGWSADAPQEAPGFSSNSWRGDRSGSASTTSKGWGVASTSWSGAETDGNSGWGTGGGGGGWGSWDVKEKDGKDNASGWGTSSADTQANNEWDWSGASVPIPKSTWGGESASQGKPSPAMPSRKPSLNAQQPTPNMATDPRFAQVTRTLTEPILDAGTKLGSLSLDGKGKGKEKERTTQRSLSISITNQTTGRLAGTAPASRASVPAIAEAIPTQIAPMGPPPTPVSKPVPQTSPIVPTNNEVDSLVSQARAMKRKLSGGMIKGDPKKSILNLSPQDRIDKYRGVLRYIQLLVYIQICLKKAKATEENWRRNNNSQYYGKSSQAARQKLEIGRKEAADRVQDLRKQRAENLQKLLTLPDIPSRSHRPYDPELDRQKIMKYTLELRNWITELDLPRRLAAYRQPLLDTLTENAPESSKVPVIPSVVDQLNTREDISIQDLNAGIEALEARVINAEENIYISAYTVSDIDHAMKEFREDFLKKRNAARMKKLSNTLTAGSQEILSADTVIRQSLEEATAVNDKFSEIQAALEDLRAKTESLNKSNEEAERMIQEAENKQEERSKLVNELSEQLATLALTRRSPRPVREITIEDIAPEIQQEIIDEVKTQLKPVMAGIIAGTRHAGEKLKEEVDKVVNEVVEKTAEVTSRAENIDALVEPSA